MFYYAKSMLDVGANPGWSLGRAEDRDGTWSPLFASTTDNLAIVIRGDEIADTEVTVSLSPTIPAVGTAFTATLTDADGGVIGTTWQWSKAGSAAGPFTDISGATSASYTPVTGDVGKYLKATASFTDALGSGKEAAVSQNAVVVTLTNEPPEFANTTETLDVVENATSGTVVDTISATDSDGDDLTYSVSGTDASAFNRVFLLNTTSGRITVRSSSSVNFEEKSSYLITLRVTDGEDASGNDEPNPTIDDTVTLTITVTQAQATTPTVSTVTITSSPGTDNTYATLDVITVGVTFSESAVISSWPYGGNTYAEGRLSRSTSG